MDGSGMQYFYTNFNVKIGITLEKINFLRKFQKEIFIFKSLHAITQNFKNTKKIMRILFQFQKNLNYQNHFKLFCFLHLKVTSICSQMNYRDCYFLKIPLIQMYYL